MISFHDSLKNGYTPEDVEEVASIYRSYYESLDEIEADLAAEGKPSNGSDYELRAENVRALRDQDLSYMDISLPLVDQEPFQEILQALLKNDMSQAANLLQYLGSHLDKLQEEHQKMQVEFRELKEQVNSIDERFFNDSDSVDTVQNNLDQSEKLITLNKSRLANVVLQTKSKLKTAGKNALLSFAEKIHVPKALASLQKGMQHTQDSLDVLFQRLNDAKQAVQDVSNSVKNVGRALTGKELLEYVPWDPEKGKIASVQRKIYAMERTLGNLQERTNTLLSKMQRPEQKPEKQVKKTTKKVI